MDKKLKIGIGADAFPPTTDGICNVVKNYADIINKKFGEAVIITPKNPNQQDYKFDYQIYRYKSWYFPSKEGYTYGWPFRDSLHQDILDMNLDVLHSHVPLATSYFFRRVAEKRKIPHILTYHTKYEYDVERRVPTEYLKNFAKNFIFNNINDADEIWVTSKGTIDSLRKFGYEGDCIVMPNGCDLPVFQVSQQEKEEIRSRLGISPHIPVFLYSGRMIWYKNIRLIIDACAKLKAKGKKFKLVMLGFGADENAIKKQIKISGIKDDVIWTGKILDRAQMQNYYAASDILLFPSVFDTNGLVVREAAASSTPSLLVKNSCSAEGITDNETGFLCDESAESIACRLEAVADNKNLLEQVGKNAQSEIYISWDDAVKTAFDRYRVVIDNFKTKNNL